jgi:CDP-glycerol glycerophosphotransferase (TagB/SpsB family)
MLFIRFSKFLIKLTKYYILFIIFIIIYNLFLNQNSRFQNTYELSKINNLDKIFFNISKIVYIFSFKYNITKIEYNISFYDNNLNIILPSFLGLFYKLFIFCSYNDIKNNIGIFYIASIYKNRYFSCIEYLNLNESIQLGVIIYKKNKYIESYNITIFNSNSIDYNNYIHIKDEEFDPLVLTKIYNLNKISIKENETKNSKNEFKNIFYSTPNFNIKKHLAQTEGIWYFKNIYNNIFCFCKYSVNSKCLYKNIKQKNKYYLYLYFIDCNKNIYNKTDYLFADFSSEKTAPGEAYLIFKEMFKQNLSVHYLTKREDIFNEYMSLNRNNSSYIPIIFDSNYINGNFLEKYFDLMLRLKVVVSGAKIYSINNLFYNLEYITYICLTHGISYIKDFLYKTYYSNKIYNKIVLPPSKKIICNAKKFGWKDKDIIKIGLPRWDLLNYYEKKKNVFHEKDNNKNKSIFIMFTWRELKKNKKISNYYFKNIIELITDKSLNIVLKKNNITLYYSLHHMIEEYKYLFNNYNYIKYVSQEKIIECLKISDLIITDFSSIIFDFMVRNKPYIIFIPDSEDNNLSNIYEENYCNIIKCLKNGTMSFQNRYFSVKSTVEKIIYYINKNFILEHSLKNFYDIFNLSAGNNIKSFIMYLKTIN